eukprot:TRINITY_DN26079_c0_g1_i1.p2 TRINITY_DN26079_c0_g1~~TRINITY_DN26079_c0_g1_i1.p2  ORF type:complete len:250 (+),score=66.34 TRINITY_DN26079_c0_g1_i1:34-750(+)
MADKEEARLLRALEKKGHKAAAAKPTPKWKLEAEEREREAQKRADEERRLKEERASQVVEQAQQGTVPAAPNVGDGPVEGQGGPVPAFRAGEPVRDESLEACQGVVGQYEEEEILGREEARIARNMNKNVDQEALERMERERQEKADREEKARIKLERRLAEAEQRKAAQAAMEEARAGQSQELSGADLEKKRAAADILSKFALPKETLQVQKPKFCPECGTPTGAGKFCAECGTKLV